MQKIIFQKWKNKKNTESAQLCSTLQATMVKDL